MTKRYQYNKKWRIGHPKTWYAGKKKYYQKTQNARNEGKRYTKLEIRWILNHIIPDAALAHMIGRSVGAIQKKRCCS